MRSYLGITDLLFTKSQIGESIETLTSVINYFVIIAGVIAIFITFFLLLISMTQNITSAIWEYGVLRSMGITKEEGRRIYLYEAFVVVASASILGFVVGICASVLISAQLFTFIEMPPVIVFPTWTFIGMLLMSLVTIFFSVYIPMKQVN